MNNKTMLYLDLAYNGAIGKSAKLIGEALAANTSLTHLDLSWNSFGNERSFNGVEPTERIITITDEKGKTKEKRIWEGGDHGSKTSQP